jgi:hypothetical protein
LITRGRAPHYRLREAHGELQPGTYVRPIEYHYLSRETKESFPTHILNHERDVVCYTSLGMLVIPRSKIEEVSASAL